MARKKQTRGNCIFCGREMTRGGLSKHLRTCPKRSEAIAEADFGPEQRIYHLAVRDSWDGHYWLHLEMCGSATLESLDEYLREIWLECCGHLSAFEIGPRRYTQLIDGGFSIGDEESMEIQVDKLFAEGMSIPYEYDFGTTSELTIAVVDERYGKALSKYPIYLMARNKMASVQCIECGKEAMWLCMQCFYEREDQRCELCDEHAKSHSCDDYGGPMPLVNSPRTGMCGYVGPAEPPY